MIDQDSAVDGDAKLSPAELREHLVGFIKKEKAVARRLRRALRGRSSTVLRDELFRVGLHVKVLEHALARLDERITPPGPDLGPLLTWRPRV